MDIKEKIAIINNLMRVKKFTQAIVKCHKLIKEKQIAALEIHKELLIEKYAPAFNYNTIQKETQKINNISVLSFEHQLVLSIAAQQINDHGYHYKHIALRNAYDVFLLSKKADAKKAISKSKNLNHPLNCFLASCYLTFGKVDSLVYKSTKETHQYLTVFNDLLTNTKRRKARRKRINRQLFIKSSLRNLFKSFAHKEYRVWLLKTISDPNWQLKKLIQLGLKN